MNVNIFCFVFVFLVAARFFLFCFCVFVFLVAARSSAPTELIVGTYLLFRELAELSCGDLLAKGHIFLFLFSFALAFVFVFFFQFFAAFARTHKQHKNYGVLSLWVKCLFSPGMRLPWRPQR